MILYKNYEENRITSLAIKEVKMDKLLNQK